MLSINFILQVQNAIDYLKIIGALDENENLTVLGKTTTASCSLFLLPFFMKRICSSLVFPSLYNVLF